METQNSPQQPEKKFSTGAISAAVWKNTKQTKEGKSFEVRTISLQRRYTDKSGKWQTTNSLRVNDLPKVALVIDEAYKYIVLNGFETDGKEEVNA